MWLFWSRPKVEPKGEGVVPEVGQYRLGQTIGKGNFGVVKEGIHSTTGEKVAIKIIPEKNLGDQLQEEIENQRWLRHQHVVQIHDVIEKGSDTNIVMELVSGGDLFDFIVRHARVPEEKARRIFQQIIAGVEHCHENGIAHRDLKPENIFLDIDNNVKIGDFGLSAKMKPGKLLTQSCGSPNYAAPELLRKGCQYEGPEVDVWSCGIILFALLCSTLPFDAPTVEELFRKIKSADYTVPGYVSPEAQDLLSKMICVKADERISISDIRQHPWFLKDLPAGLFKSTAAGVVKIDENSIVDVDKGIIDVALVENSQLQTTMKSFECLLPVLSAAALLVEIAKTRVKASRTTLAVSPSLSEFRRLSQSHNLHASRVPSSQYSANAFSTNTLVACV